LEGLVTLWDIGSALIRRWYIVVCGLVSTAVIGYSVSISPGVYFARTEMVFFAPTSDANPNTLMTTSSDIVVFASVIATIINGANTTPKSASPDATIVGRGIRDGYAIELPDMGGQWAPNFDRPVLDIQVVAPSEDEAAQRTNAILDRITGLLRQVQDDAAVNESDRITGEALPDQPAITYFGGQAKRAMVMTLSLGLLLTISAVIFVEGLARSGKVREPRVRHYRVRRQVANRT
jgi:hypothetical protein